jgi:hypothetical protein
MQQTAVQIWAYQQMILVNLHTFHKDIERFDITM